MVVPAYGLEGFLVALDTTLTDEAGVALLYRLSAYARPRRGALVVAVIERGRVDGTAVLFNSALLFAADGSVAAIYRTRVLAPFGEYNPIPNPWPGGEAFLARIPGTPAVAAGRRFIPLRFGTTPRRVALGVMICFESAFPALAREAEARGATHLLNISHDQWAWSRHAMRQHADHAVLRSLETRQPIMRLSHGG